MKKLLWLGFVGIWFVAGCAAHMPSASLGGANFLAAHRVTIGSVSYLPASAVAQVLGAQEEWDPQTNVWTIRAGGHEIKATANMPMVLIDGKPQPLGRAPIVQDGQLMLPEQVWTQGPAGWRMPGVPTPSLPSGVRLGTIVIDAGHGGHDAGAIGPKGLREKSVALDVALRLRDALERDGFRVIMTRSDDRFIPLGRRSEIANRAEADLFVSIHANASRRRSVSGYEVYYLSEAMDDHARALETTENADLPSDVGGVTSNQTEAIVWDLVYTENRAESTELASAIARSLKSAQVYSKNRGVKSARFAVLRGSRMPAVLVEVGFITNPGEEAALRSGSYRQKLAGAVRNGIVNFKREYEHKL